MKSPVLFQRRDHGVTETDIILEGRNLTKMYGSVRALNNRFSSPPALFPSLRSTPRRNAAASCGASLRMSWEIVPELESWAKISPVM